MTIQDWVSLAFICILGAFSPGPSLIVILSVTASAGRKAGYLASFGHGTGVFLYALMAATGLIVLIKTSLLLFSIIQFLGAVFLAFVGIRILKSVFWPLPRDVEETTTRNTTNRFWQGFAVAILNPKIAAFFLSLFSQFLGSGQTSITHLGMATLAGLIDTAAYFLMVAWASTSMMTNFLDRYKRSVEVGFGVLLCLLAFSLFIQIILYS